MKAHQLLQKDKQAFERIPAPCPVFGTCGGCSLQDLRYSDQLALKQQRLLRALGALDPSLTVEVQGLEEPWRYRNKAEFTFGQGGDRGVLGYHAARSFWKIVDLDDCLLMPESVGPVLRDMRAIAHASGVSAYNPKTHQGCFRYLIVRISHDTGKLLLCLVTTQAERSAIEAMADRLLARHPAIAGFYWGVNLKLADIATPDELVLLRGAPYLEDRLGPFTITFHPLNFVQPTPAMAERLYAALAELANDAPSGAAWDLYCGIGFVSFYLASKYRTVYGIDSDPGNLELARLNAAANGLGNVQFHVGLAEDLLANKRFWLTEARPELIVVDPPRCGLHPRVIGALLAARPKQVLYVSCNAQALVRDLQELVRGFPRYRICRVIGFDLFPHTPHLEVLTLLERV